jgi:hypothetical protein
MRRKAIIALVFIVAAAVLVESWHAAMNAAETGGRPWPWLWPATLEAFIFVLVLVYWDARSAGNKARTARVFLVLTTAVASAVQVLDAPQTPLGWLTAGWTPVALLLSVEFAVGRLYQPAARWDPTPPPPPPDPDADEDQDQPDPDQDQPRRINGATLTTDQEAMVRAWVADGRRNKSQMARDLNLNNRGRLAVGRLVDQLVPSGNGTRPGGGS